MRRRELIIGAGSSLVAPLAAAQQQPMPVVAWVGFKVGERQWERFERGLHDLGYDDGRNIRLLFFFGKESDIDFAGPIAALTRANVNVIAAAGFPATAAVRSLASSIPVVFVVADPVGAGFVASLAHPGGNMTGVSLDVEEEFSGKWLELLREIRPRSARVGYIWNPANHSSASSWQAMRRLAPKLGLTLVSAQLRDVKALDVVLAEVRHQTVDGLILDSDALTGLVQSEIAAFARENRLPLISVFRRAVDAGGLLSYGPNLPQLWRRAAVYVDKILKGTKPADLPVEQPTTFELVVNLKTAKAIGLAVPASLLQRADEVIE